MKLKSILNEMALKPKGGGTGTDLEDVHPPIEVGTDYDEVLPTNSPIIHTFKKNGIDVHAAYVFNEKKKNQSDLKTKIRVAVKDTSNQNNFPIIQKLLNRKIYAMKRKGVLDNIDFIIPLGSKSKLNDMISEDISKQCPGSRVLTNVLQKMKWKNVQVEDLGEDSKKGYELAKKKLEVMKQKFPEEEFQIKTVGSSQSLRRYFTCFYGSPDGKIDIINDIVGKSVLLVDDTFEEGVTMREAQRVVRGSNPGKVQAFVFLYGN